MTTDRRDDDYCQSPCLLDYAPFDELLRVTRGAANRVAVREVERICGGCEIREQCHAKADVDDEDWFKSYANGLKVIERNPDIDRPRVRRRKPDELRALHSRYERLRKAGEEIPAEVRDGERQYQQRRHERRKKAAA